MCHICLKQFDFWNLINLAIVTSNVICLHYQPQEPCSTTWVGSAPDLCIHPPWTSQNPSKNDSANQIVTDPKAFDLPTKTESGLNGNDVEWCWIAFDCFGVMDGDGKYWFSTAKFGFSTTFPRHIFGISTRGPSWDHAPPGCVFDFPVLPQHVFILSQAVWL